MDGRAWWAAVHGVAGSWTQLGDFTFTFYFHTLEKEMATHSSVLAWRIPGTGEPGRLPSTGLQSWTRLKRLSSSSRKDQTRYMVKSVSFTYLNPLTNLPLHILHCHLTHTYTYTNTWNLPWVFVQKFESHRLSTWFHLLCYDKVFLRVHVYQNHYIKWLQLIFLLVQILNAVWRASLVAQW